MKYENRKEYIHVKHDILEIHDDHDDVDDIDDDKDLYWYEVVVVSSFLKCLKNQTALLRHKRLV